MTHLSITRSRIAKYSYGILTVLVNAGVFSAISLLLQHSTEKNIAFITAELQGVHDHRQLMPLHMALHQKEMSAVNDSGIEKIQQIREVYGVELVGASQHDAIYTTMLEVGDRSNLILDPDLGSYYLMNIVIRLAPEMITVLDEKEGSQHVLANLEKQLARSVQVSKRAGIEVVMLEKVAELLGAEFSAWQKGTPIQRDRLIEAIGNVYRSASLLLEESLERRLHSEQAHCREIMLLIIMLFIACSALSLIVVHYYGKRKDYKAAQEKLTLMGALEKTNAELESFSYFTAHDLKEPVRTVACFAALLEEDDKLKLNEEGRKHITIIRQAALRMDRLINDILTYICEGASGQHIPTERVDTEAEVRSILEEISVLVKESDAHIAVEKMPFIHAHPASFHRVMQNLIINAIKYRRAGVSPQITIRCSENPDEWVFEVADNGQGFDMAEAQTIVKPFKQLNADKSEGSGIGLSICHKTLSQQSGRLWFESKPMHGTRAFFSIPFPSNENDHARRDKRA